MQINDSNLILLMFLGVIFYDVISRLLPYGNYLDESIVLFVFILFVIKKFHSKIIRINVLDAKFILFCIISITCGVISNLAFGYVSSIGVIFRDIVGLFKFFLSFYAFDYLLIGRVNGRSIRKIIKCTKVLVAIIFFFGVISAFADIGMGDSVRFGIRSYKFIYSYYNVLVYVEVFLLSILLLERKKFSIYFLMSYITLFLTLRSKGILVIIMAIVIQLVRATGKDIVRGRVISKFKYIIPTLCVAFLFLKEKIYLYFSYGKYNTIRIGALTTGLDIIKDHFPLGSGFGSYGTNLSYASNSPLYSLYPQVNYEWLLDPRYGFATMSDTYWPAIYAQMGIIGFIFFVGCMILILKKIKNDRVAGNDFKQSCFFIMLYLLVVSLTEAIFINEVGLTAALMIGILMNARCNCEKKW